MKKNLMYQACFDLASTLMAEKDSMTVEKVEQNVTEQTEMTDTLYRFALEHSFRIKGLSIAKREELISRAIKYIHYVHALPTLKGEYAWFDEMLRVLVELANPEIVLNEENIEFLDDIRKGIRRSKKDILK